MSYQDTLNFILQSAKSLHENGLPTHRLEERMNEVCRSLQVDGQFFSTPGSIFASITIAKETHSHMIKVTDSELNLEKMDEIERIIQQVVNQDLEPKSGILELNRTKNIKNRYSGGITTLFIGVSTAAAACVFGGQIPEILGAFIIGLGIGGLGLILRFIPQLDKVYVLLSAVWAVLISGIFQSYFKDYQTDIATICGLILLIPGFTFTISITEMVNNHLVAGISRFTTAFITFVMLAIGIAIGKSLISKLNLVEGSEIWNALPYWKEWIALIFVPLGFVVLFKAKPRDFLWIFIGCWISYFSFKISSHITSNTTAVFIASLLLGVSSNLFSRIKMRNPSVMLVPGMILLVPGSLGFLSISKLVASDVVAGIQIALSMLTTSMALVLGIIFSNILVRTSK
jgi:uncharacterized membrane protein YjjP (DUF1212 family)